MSCREVCATANSARVGDIALNIRDSMDMPGGLSTGQKEDRVALVLVSNICPRILCSIGKNTDFSIQI